jgi:hypothetical protein
LHLALILLNNYCVTIRAKSFWHMSIGCKGDEARSVSVMRVHDLTVIHSTGARKGTCVPKPYTLATPKGPRVSLLSSGNPDAGVFAAVVGIIDRDNTCVTRSGA